MGRLEEFKEKFKEAGVEPKNIAKATGYFLAISYTYTALLVGLCYVFKPTENIVHKLPYPKVKQAFDNASKKAFDFKFLNSMNAQRRARVTLAFTEMFAIRTLTGPVALPLRISLAIYLTKLSNS